jgi:trans-2-enoyl-CoA reductase
MKQVIYEEFGDPGSVLKLVDRVAPTLQEGQARVSVLRSPINPSDLIQISGNYGVRPTLPAIAGNEGLGRVVEVRGDGISVGQLVLIPAGSGAWVTETVANIGHLVPLPEGDMDQLSMLMVNPATAHLLLSIFVELQPGDWVIQSAANSAVGGYLVQLAKSRGVNVVSVVRRESAIEGLKELGAECILVDGPDLVKQVKAVTDAEMKLAVDAVAGDTFGRLAETLEIGGTIVGYGAMSGAPAELSAGAMIFRDVRVRGFWLMHWFQQASTAERMQVYSALTKEVAEGTLYAPVDRLFSLEEIAEAATYSGAGRRKGKVMLAPNGV